MNFLWFFSPIKSLLRDQRKEDLRIVRQNYFSDSHVHSVTLGNHLKLCTSDVKEQCYLSSKDDRLEFNKINNNNHHTPIDV